MKSVAPKVEAQVEVNEKSSIPDFVGDSGKASREALIEQLLKQDLVKSVDDGLSL